MQRRDESSGVQLPRGFISCSHALLLLYLLLLLSRRHVREQQLRGPVFQIQHNVGIPLVPPSCKLLLPRHALAVHLICGTLRRERSQDSDLPVLLGALLGRSYGAEQALQPVFLQLLDLHDGHHFFWRHVISWMRTEAMQDFNVAASVGT
jgi:hypothetical protein